MTQGGLGALAAVPSAGRAEIRFELLAFEGVEEGRAKFERLVTDVVKVIHPTARAVAANPGDWGIDTYVGELDGGEIAVWQSKFFLEPGDNDSRQSQIRESFKSATSKADDEGLTLTSWTLTIPGTMDAPMQQWWTGWRRRQIARRGAGFEIQLWEASELRSYLMKDDFSHIRQQYFGADPASPLRRIEEPDDPAKYNGALFIKQLHAAGVNADSTARRAFFNAEVLTRDINERAADTELAELNGMRATIEQLWSTRFETARAVVTNDTSGQLPGLYPDVCRAIETHHTTHPSAVLRDTLVHRTGLVHHLADDGQIGWVQHYARIAAEHAGSAS